VGEGAGAGAGAGECENRVRVRVSESKDGRVRVASPPNLCEIELRRRFSSTDSSSPPAPASFLFHRLFLAPQRENAVLGDAVVTQRLCVVEDVPANIRSGAKITP
jgi:hypothetical protein